MTQLWNCLLKTAVSFMLDIGFAQNNFFKQLHNCVTSIHITQYLHSSLRATVACFKIIMFKLTITDFPNAWQICSTSISPVFLFTFVHSNKNVLYFVPIKVRIIHPLAWKTAICNKILHLTFICGFKRGTWINDFSCPNPAG